MKKNELALIPQTKPASEVKAGETQPIPAEKLKSCWVEYLEIRNRRLDIVEMERALERDAIAVDARRNSLLESAGVSLTDWRVDFRNGTMTRL